MLFPNEYDSGSDIDGISRRRLLASGATASAVAAAGCTGDDGGSTPDQTTAGSDDTDSGSQSTVFVFNTGEGTVSLLDPKTDTVIETVAVGLSSSFPSNQYTPEITADEGDSLWVNVGRGVRGLSAGSLSETAAFDTGSGANWLEQTPDGSHVVVSAREPTHAQYLIDGDPGSESFGEVIAEIDRKSEGGRGGNDGPGPCDVTIHPDGDYAYVPDLFGDTLTVLSIDPFEIESQITVEPVGDGPPAPWMGTVAPDGRTLLVEHNEGGNGTESVWDLSDPASPSERTRLTATDDLGKRPLTSEIGPDSEIGYVFTPGSNDVTVVNLDEDRVTERLDLGGSAFVGTWNPLRTKLYVPIQTTDEVAVIDHEQQEIVERIDVGSSPYGATAARVRPESDSSSSLEARIARLGLSEESETTYCIGNCGCGHEL